MGRNQDHTNLVWKNIRANLAMGSDFLRSRETAEGLAGTTLQSAIADAIYDIDSSAFDPVESLGEGSTEVVGGTGRSTVRKGRLQRVEDLLRFYYGDDEREGFFALANKQLSEPEV